ncbi:DUF2274 domain-containing protein [Lichenicoccus sp.]|uniref:DUF2274 domain-containing protein n=1 Tax=Lichenicoccus sp. TaxID=2781899 RepID=UPI003D0BB38A
MDRTNLGTHSRRVQGHRSCLPSFRINDLWLKRIRKPKLKLGPLPDEKPVKATVTLSAELAGLIASHGAAVGSTDGKPPSMEQLIPPIIQRFHPQRPGVYPPAPAAKRQQC